MLLGWLLWNSLKYAGIADGLTALQSLWEIRPCARTEREREQLKGAWWWRTSLHTSKVLYLNWWPGVQYLLHMIAYLEKPTRQTIRTQWMVFVSKNASIVLKKSALPWKIESPLVHFPVSCLFPRPVVVWQSVEVKLCPSAGCNRWSSATTALIFSLAVTVLLYSGSPLSWSLSAHAHASAEQI